MEPIIAFGLFLTEQTCSIITDPVNIDPTIKLLYKLANEHYKSINGNHQHLIEVVGMMCDHQYKEDEKLLELIDNGVPASLLIENIKNAKSRNHDLKRKYAQIDEAGVVDLEATIAATSTETTTATEAEYSLEMQSPYEKGMLFVEDFKRSKIENGLLRMDLLSCLT